MPASDVKGLNGIDVVSSWLTHIKQSEYQAARFCTHVVWSSRKALR